MRRTTRVAAAGLGVTSLLALSACGGDDNGGGGGDADADAWILTGGGWPAIQEDFDRWNEANEDAQIDTEAIENDSYKGQIRTAVGSGEAPTLIMSWTGGALLEYAEEERIVDLSEHTGELESRVFDSVWQNGQVDDSTYAVPLNDVQPVVMYYNQSVFDEAGVEIPETWEDVEAAIDTFNENDVAPFSLAGGSVWPALMWLQYLTDRHGGEEVFQAVVEGEEGAWDNESILFALETMQDLGENGGFIDTYNSVTADQNEDAQLLADGQAAMLLQGSWVYSTIHQDFPEFAESGDFGFTSFPTLEDGAGDPSNIVGNPANFWSVSADASEEEQQIAFDYISENLYNEETVTSMLEAGSLPPLSDIEDQIAETDDADFLEFSSGLVGEANHFQLSWDQAVAPEVAQPLTDNLSQILRGDMTPEQFVEAMNSL
ncbi:MULTISPECIES: extracellular solute-binding protein [unclassified Nesterenkonia]|uniref:extracellular solute-binding protein n=1 Tax=unclassified Nesterenkonia TaxID=2629769 RepID=UPI001F4D25B2|nr:MULTISPECIES: extracellular solute-binding protein [unclassified Nesterenkonia]MCH8560998.1 extracellular solute-binding protein [Nesterenkonia sp. DZ6]MCH8563392.1 extracellular solute-binding protein [Nesterenkonia sp. YGD6]